MTYSIFTSVEKDDLLPARMYAAELRNSYQRRMFMEETNQNRKHRDNETVNKNRRTDNGDDSLSYRNRILDNDDDYGNFTLNDDSDTRGDWFGDSVDDPSPHRNSHCNQEF